MGISAEGSHRGGTARLVERPQLLRHVQEAGALAKHVANAKQKHSSDLVRELADVRGTRFGLTASPEEVERETLDALRSAKTTLQSKAPEELEPYRQLVVDVAQSVADAAGGGDTSEGGAIEKVRSAIA